MKYLDFLRVKVLFLKIMGVDNYLCLEFLLVFLENLILGQAARALK